MLESWLGPDVFRDAFAVPPGAPAQQRHHGDLWQALGEVSGQPVREFATGWTEQPGSRVTVSALGANS